MTTKYDSAEQEGRALYRRGWPLPRGAKARDRARRRGWLLEASRVYPGTWTAKIPPPPAPPAHGAPPDPRRSGPGVADPKPAEGRAPEPGGVADQTGS